MGTYLVTGGAGFIGSHLVTALTERGDQVHVLDDLSTGRRQNLAHLDPASAARVRVIAGSITDPAACREACSGVSGVFHQAAQVSVPQSVEDPAASFEANAVGTLKLLEAARSAGADRFVLAASSAAYGDTEELPKVESVPPDPLSPYAAGKVAAEYLLRSWGKVYGMRTVSLRYFNVFGPRQADDSPYTGVIAIFARALLEGRRPTIFGDGEQSRDFTYVTNVVRANLLAMEADVEPGIVLNVGAGERISLNELYRTMAAIVGRDLEPIYAEERTGDVRHSLASLDRVRRVLGYAPEVDWRKGLGWTLDWYRERFQADAAS